MEEKRILLAVDGDFQETSEDAGSGEVENEKKKSPQKKEKRKIEDTVFPIFDHLKMGIKIGREEHGIAILPPGKNKAITFMIDNNQEGFVEFQRAIEQNATSIPSAVGIEQGSYYGLPLLKWMHKNFPHMIFSHVQFPKEKRDKDEKAAIWVLEQLCHHRGTRKIDNLDGYIERVITKIGLPPKKDEVEDDVDDTFWWELLRVVRERDGVIRQMRRPMQKLSLYLAILFPELEGGIFNNLWGKNCMTLLRNYPFPEDILRLPTQYEKQVLSEQERHDVIVAKLRNLGIFKKYCEAIYNAAVNTIALSPQQFGVDRSLFNGFLNEVSRLQVKRAELTTTLEEMLPQSYYAKLLSIPGVGSVVAATLLSELSRFNKPLSDNLKEGWRQLTAFAGLAPRAVDKNGNVRITRRPQTGRLRAILYNAANSAKKSDKELKALYDKHYKARKAAGKRLKPCLIKVMDQLLKRVYIILKEIEKNTGKPALPRIPII